MSLSSVLIVDDNRTEHFLMEAMIEDYDSSITILHAYDGQEALDMIGSGSRPDLILLDINMPGMNGLEFLREYSRHEKQSYVMVAVVSSSDLDADKQEAMQYDFVKQYFVKPLSRDEIKNFASKYWPAAA